MKTHFHMAVIAALIACMPAAPSHAQTAPAADTAATPAPAASPAPTATPPAAASTDRAGTPDKAAGESAPAKRSSKMSTREQVEHSIKTRTVPARYRSQIPKEYQKYIPFEK
jgi:hypothetical protein